MLLLQSPCYTLSTQAVSTTQGQVPGEPLPRSALLSSQSSASVGLARSSQSVLGADGGVPSARADAVLMEQVNCGDQAGEGKAESGTSF